MREFGMEKVFLFGFYWTRLKRIIHMMLQGKSLLLFGLMNVFLIFIYMDQQDYPSMVYHEWMGGVFKRMSDGITSWKAYLSLREENEQLREENEQLKNRLSSNFLVEYRTAEGNKSKVFLDDTAVVRGGDVPIQKYRWVRGRVMQTMAHFGSSSFMVSLGAADGIQKGMLVVGTKGMLGKVIKVYPTYCLVASFFHKNFALAAKVGKYGSSGILQWNTKHFFNLTLSEVPVQDSAQVGDSIYTSHLSYHIPSDVLIGKVVAIRHMDSYYDQLTIAPVEVWKKARSVYIIRDEQPRDDNRLNEIDEIDEVDD